MAIFGLEDIILFQEGEGRKIRRGSKALAVKFAHVLGK